jgi:hypothetical protein
MLILYMETFLAPAKGSDLPFEALLQEYLQFPYEYLLLVFLPFGGYS